VIARSRASRRGRDRLRAPVGRSTSHSPTVPVVELQLGEGERQVGSRVRSLRDCAGPQRRGCRSGSTGFRDGGSPKRETRWSMRARTAGWQASPRREHEVHDRVIAAPPRKDMHQRARRECRCARSLGQKRDAKLRDRCGAERGEVGAGKAWLVLDATPLSVRMNELPGDLVLVVCRGKRRDRGKHPHIRRGSDATRPGRCRDGIFRARCSDRIVSSASLSKETRTRIATSTRSSMSATGRSTATSCSRSPGWWRSSSGTARITSSTRPVGQLQRTTPCGSLRASAATACAWSMSLRIALHRS
jgi:hypothetical protein